MSGCIQHAKFLGTYFQGNFFNFPRLFQVIFDQNKWQWFDLMTYCNLNLIKAPSLSASIQRRWQYIISMHVTGQNGVSDTPNCKVYRVLRLTLITKVACHGPTLNERSRQSRVSPGKDETKNIDKMHFFMIFKNSWFRYT